jgi:hypothetical protein
MIKKSMVIFIIIFIIYLFIKPSISFAECCTGCRQEFGTTCTTCGVWGVCWYNYYPTPDGCTMCADSPTCTNPPSYPCYCGDCAPTNTPAPSEPTPEPTDPPTSNPPASCEGFTYPTSGSEWSDNSYLTVRFRDDGGTRISHVRFEIINEETGSVVASSYDNPQEDGYSDINGGGGFSPKQGWIEDDVVCTRSGSNSSIWTCTYSWGYSIPDSGNYTLNAWAHEDLTYNNPQCSATNVYNQTECDDPGQPSVTVSNITHNSAKLNWDAVAWNDSGGGDCKTAPDNNGGCGSSRGWYVEIWHGTNLEAAECLAEGARSWDATGLDANTEYEYRVWSINSCGCDKRKLGSFETALACATGLSVNCNASGDEADFSWNSISGAVGYVFRLNREPFDDWANTSEGDQWDNDVNTNSYTTNVECDMDYDWNVQGIKEGEGYPYSGCVDSIVDGLPGFSCSCPAAPTLTPTSYLHGKVYDVTEDSPDARCWDTNGGYPASSPVETYPVLEGVTVSSGSGSGDGFSMSTKVDGSYEVVVDYGQMYTISAAKTDYTVERSYDRTHNSDCTDASNPSVLIDNYVTELDFGLSNAVPPWYQVAGGDISAYEGGITDMIPITCVNDGSCLEYITIDNEPNLYRENGVAGAKQVINAGEGGYGEPENWRAPNDDQLSWGVGKGYAHLYELWVNESQTETISGDASLSSLSGLSTCQVGVDEILIKLIDGNLSIENGCNPEVAEGGLLIIAVSGDIEIGDEVTRVEGIYLADGNIIINGVSENEGNQIILEGSFGAGIDGTGQMLIERDLGGPDGGVSNNDTPAALFKYRPDFIVNAIINDINFAEAIKWEEINP